MEEKLNVIFRMVDYIRNYDEKNEDLDWDLVVHYQCELPEKLHEIETELRTMFEGYKD